MPTNHRNISTLVPMTIVAFLFFIFGFVTWINGSLIPFLSIACELNHLEAYFVTLVFYIAYTVTALPASMVLHRVGYKNGLMIGLLVIAAGSLLFIPAAYSRLYSLFLLAMFVLGTGLTIMQTAANPYVVHLGPRESAAVRIAIMGIFNKSAGIVGPIIFTALFLSNMEQFTEARLASLDPMQRIAELNELTSRMVTPYAIASLLAFIFAIALKLSPLPELDINEMDDDSDPAADKGNILQHPHLVLGVITLFCYVGVEVIAGDTIGLYGRDLGVSNFGELTAYTMAFMVLAYILGMATIPRFISQESALTISAVLGILFSILVVFGSRDSETLSQILFGWAGIPTIPDTVLFVALLGFANAMIWPTVWPLALHNLGRLTATGSALLIMGLSGGALFPLAYGALADSNHNTQTSYWIMIPCYIFILFYALKGHKLRNW